MRKYNIAILFGGISAEHEVSLKSACAVISHLNLDKINPILLGITREGVWLHYEGAVQAIAADTWHTAHCTQAIISPCRSHGGILELAGEQRVIPLDAAFPVMHGSFGEDGTLQGLLELAGIPIVGCGALASALCMDKDKAHLLAACAGIRVPRAYRCTRETPPARLEAQAQTLGYPLFVKPLRAGSSFGVSMVKKASDLHAAVQNAGSFDDTLLMEEAISGFEVGCAVIGDADLTVGAVDEVELLTDFFDYQTKYGDFGAKTHVPARISEAQAQSIKDAAMTVYRALGCTGFARVDLFLTPEGEIVFNEVNTIPGFTSHSRFPSMMQCVGMEFSQLLDALIEAAVKR